MVFQANPYSVLLVSASEKLNTAVLPLFPGSDFWPVTAVNSLSRAKRLLLQQSYDLVVINAPLPDGMGTDFAMKLCGETDAAVALLADLTSEESIRELGSSSLSGRLLDSAEDMKANRQMVSPLQDAMNSKAREVWLLECIPAVAAGKMTPEECWRRVMALNPFGE